MSHVPAGERFVSPVSTAPEARETTATATIHPHEVGVATTTFYRNWELPGERTHDNVRGDLALFTLHTLQKEGYSLYVVDGGSSPAFLEELEARGIATHPEEERGMGASRRQAFNGAYLFEGTKATAWTEPEKVDAPNFLPRLAHRIAQGADGAVPHRGKGMLTYPDYQRRFEVDCNQKFNQLLQERGRLAADAPEIDAWSGPRLFRKSEEIRGLFMQQFEFTEEAGLAFAQDMPNYKAAPDLWANFLFISLASALDKGLRVDSVDVPYMHPASQTALELKTKDDGSERKRDFQARSILTATAGYLDFLEGNPNAAVRPKAA